MAATPCGSVRRNGSETIAGGWLISLEDQLKKNDGIELHVAYLTTKKEDYFQYEGVNYYPICLKQSVNPIIKAFQRRYKESINEKLVCKQIRQCVDFVKPDLIHVHGTEGMMGQCVYFVKDIPVVFSIQGLIAPYKEKYFSGIPKYDAYRYDNLFDIVIGIGIRTQWKSFLYRAKREISYIKEAKYIYGRTFWDKYCTLAINPGRKYYKVNEILRPEFYSKQWKGYISKDKIRIVSTISGGIYKGFETVLKTAFLLKTYGNIDFEWHVAGYTQKTKWVQICEKISRIAAKRVNIKFYGRIDAGKLSDLLCSSDFYVHVSHIENSPNSVCEAMLLGMPVIATFTGGTASLLQDQKEGILYQDGDPYVLSGAIINLCKNPQYAINLGASAYKIAHYRHDKERVVKELLDGYKSIINDFYL